jgi:hypothetical protein
MCIAFAVHTYAAPAPDMGNPISVDLTASYTEPTVEQLESALYYDMKLYADDYLAAAEEYGVNVYLLCAKDALESGWGRYEAAPNNWGGWTAGNGYKEFSSVHEYIKYSAKNIKNMYLTPRPIDAPPDDITGCHFNGYTLKKVNISYNGSDTWLNKVSGIWYEIEGRCAEYARTNPNEAAAGAIQSDTNQS